MMRALELLAQPRRWVIPYRWRHALWGYSFVAPGLLLFLVTVLWPSLRALYLSLYRWPLGEVGRQFVGLENFRLILEDALFRIALRNTLYFTVATVPATLILTLCLAVLLNHRNLPARGMLRAAYFLPSVSPLVAVAFVWRWLLEPTFGPINWALRALGLPAPGWLGSPTWALPGIMLMTVWRDIGFYTVVFLAGLQTIPREMYDAAAIDGARGWQTFRFITLPLLNPTIVLAAVVAVIDRIQVFTPIYVMTTGGANFLPGGPLNSTRTIVLEIYFTAFRRLDLGYAAAETVILLLLLLGLTILQLRLLERRFEY
ncbi:MAG: sugar ABC transporter permease [Anaerolineae bacterium]|nr:sugar ABC transporter permease [Anaerolineae bacterium]